MKTRDSTSDKTHKIQTEERDPCSVLLRDMSAGDVVVREGTAVMVLRPPPLVTERLPEADKVWICNLTNGSIWPASGADLVWPCHDVRLTYTTGRRGCAS
jgi:hypothetical protein